MSDDDLEQQIGSLHETLGRMPTLEEIVQHAGGCQRARAVAARRAFARRRATEQAEFAVAIPDCIQSELTRLLQRWTEMARAQVAPVVDEVVADCEERISKAEEMMGLAMSQLDAAERHQAAQASELTLLREQVAKLERRAQRLALSEARWKTKAIERQEMLDREAEGST